MASRRWKVRGVRQCAREGCSREFTYTWVTEKETECPPHRAARTRFEREFGLEKKPKRITAVVKRKVSNAITDKEPAHSDSEAKKLMERSHLVPTVPYLGYREPWPSRCYFCVKAFHPTLEQVVEHYVATRKRFCSCPYRAQKRLP